MEQLAFLPGEREDRHEGEQDDRHGEEHRTPDQPRRFQHRVAHRGAVAASTRRCSMKRNAFSVTTMPASTSTPIAIAIPARLMMFDEMPA